MIEHAPLWPSVDLSEAAGTEWVLLIVECDVVVEELLVNRSGLEEPSAGPAARLRPLLVKRRMLDNLAEFHLFGRIR